jgi:hypothetical protein
MSAQARSAMQFKHKFYCIFLLGSMLWNIYVRNLQIFVIRWSVCPWQAFPPYPNVCGQGQSKQILSAPIKGKLLALSLSMRLGWKSLSGTNTPAYYENSQISAKSINSIF